MSSVLPGFRLMMVKTIEECGSPNGFTPSDCHNFSNKWEIGFDPEMTLKKKSKKLGRTIFWISTFKFEEKSNEKTG
ncbi:hypothetical protein KJ966_19405 [bacterium]|nr:hypothetical protein [bacterium]